jgi:hypothetical protein
MAKRSWQIDGLTLIIIVAILAGVLNNRIEKSNPTPKEKAVVVEMKEKSIDKVKFFDGVVKAVYLDDSYEVGDTVLVERK